MIRQMDLVAEMYCVKWGHIPGDKFAIIFRGPTFSRPDCLFSKTKTIQPKQKHKISKILYVKAGGAGLAKRG